MNVKKRGYLIALLLLSGILIYFIGINLSSGWSYVKVNDKVYVANSNDFYEEISYKQIGATQYKEPSFLKPMRNNGSNALPYGHSIYEGEDDTEIFIKLGELKYIKLVSIDSTENWKNGIKVKL